MAGGQAGLWLLVFALLGKREHRKLHAPERRRYPYPGGYRVERTRDNPPACGNAGSSLGDISAIVISHEHGDHCRGVAPFAKKPGYPDLYYRRSADCFHDISGVAQVQAHSIRSRLRGLWFFTSLPFRSLTIRRSRWVLPSRGRA